jgi:hypothetical protein
VPDLAEGQMGKASRTSRTTLQTGRNEIEPPTLRYSAGCHSSVPSGTIRLSRLRLISRALGGLAIQRDTGLCGSVGQNVGRIAPTAQRVPRQLWKHGAAVEPGDQAALAGRPLARSASRVLSLGVLGVAAEVD